MQKQPANLSKSSFIKSLQCLKSLYLYKNFYHLRDKPSPELQLRFQQGSAIGKLAWELFPNGIDYSPPSFFPAALTKAARNTAQALLSPPATLYEATFKYGQTMAIVDILVKNEQQLCAYEVKSSVSLTETYILDAAFQYYVMKGAGFQPEQFSIIHLQDGYDSSCKRSNCLRSTDVTDMLLDLQNMIGKHVLVAIRAMTQSSLLEMKVGEHCFTPYPCDFRSFCASHPF
jgi:hypothetical protein